MYRVLAHCFRGQQPFPSKGVRIGDGGEAVQVIQWGLAHVMLIAAAQGNGGVRWLAGAEG